MSWSEILNHKPAYERFKRSVENNRLASTYLFVGPAGVGKRTFALKLAEALLCETNPESGLDPCGNCAACQQVRAQSHPDLILVSKPKDKAFIPVETFIGDREHRRREGLCHDIGLKPFRGGRKIAIIDDADFLNQESANSLLKTLEEPPPKSVLILIGTSEHRQLSTIVSRSQVVRFGRLSNDELKQILTQNQLIESDVPLENLALAAGGSVELASQLADAETLEFRKTLFDQLATLDPGSGDFGKSVLAFVDSAGKDAAVKRRRLSLVCDFTIAFYRQSIQAMCLGEPTGDPGLDESAGQLAARFADNSSHGAEIASLCIQRTMDLQRQVAANVNQANAVMAWLIDLGRLGRSERVTSVESW